MKIVAFLEEPSTKEVLNVLMPKIAPYMDIEANTSKSFQAFVSVIRRFCS